MFKKVLKYINSIPFQFTIKHYQNFGSSSASLKNGELNSSESWDTLRLNHPQFSISKNREEWLKASSTELKKDGQDGGLIQRAKDINFFLKSKGINNIFSVGVGGAGLEYQIKKNYPEVKIVCSEFAKENVALLKSVFIEANQIIEFDVLKGDWKNVIQNYLDESSIVLMYRIDASFTDQEWASIFKELHTSKISKILFIPSPPLTLISLFNRKWREIKWLTSETKPVFSGYLRTKKTFESYWSDLYTFELKEFGGLKGFFLRRK